VLAYRVSVALGRLTRVAGMGLVGAVGQPGLQLGVVQLVHRLGVVDSHCIELGLGELRSTCRVGEVEQLEHQPVAFGSHRIAGIVDSHRIGPGQGSRKRGLEFRKPEPESQR
jgi:hypothetical protein